MGHIALENWGLFLGLSTKAISFSLCDELDSRKGSTPKWQDSGRITGVNLLVIEHKLPLPCYMQYEREKDFKTVSSKHFALANHKMWTDKQKKESKSSHFQLLFQAFLSAFVKLTKLKPNPCSSMQ